MVPACVVRASHRIFAVLTRLCLGSYTVRNIRKPVFITTTFLAFAKVGHRPGIIHQDGHDLIGHGHGLVERMVLWKSQ